MKWKLFTLFTLILYSDKDWQVYWNVIEYGLLKCFFFILCQAEVMAFNLCISLPFKYTFHNMSGEEEMAAISSHTASTQPQLQTAVILLVFTSAELALRLVKLLLIKLCSSFVLFQFVITWKTVKLFR